MEEISSLVDFNRAIKLKKDCLIYTSKSKFILKETNMTEWEILALSSIMDYVASRGFENLIIFKKDLSGKPFHRDEKRIYLIYNYLEGSKLKLNSVEEGKRFSEFTAKFHNAAEGYFQPTGIKAAVLWGKKTEEFRGLSLRIEKNYKALKSKKADNELETYILEYGEEIMKRVRASMKILKSTGYLKALENSMKKKEICINKISNNTAIVNNNEIILKKVFDMGYNMVEEDIALIVKKIIEDTGDINAYDSILGSYIAVRDLYDGSLPIIRALAAFPEETVKIIDKYFKTMQFDEAATAKFKKYWGKESKLNLLGV